MSLERAQKSIFTKTPSGDSVADGWRAVFCETLSFYLILELMRAPITRYHTLVGLNDRGLFSHRLGGWKSNIKVLA